MYFMIVDLPEPAFPVIQYTGWLSPSSHSGKLLHDAAPDCEGTWRSMIQAYVCKMLSATAFSRAWNDSNRKRAAAFAAMGPTEALGALVRVISELSKLSGFHSCCVG